MASLVLSSSAKRSATLCIYSIRSGSSLVLAARTNKTRTGALQLTVRPLSPRFFSQQQQQQQQKSPVGADPNQPWIPAHVFFFSLLLSPVMVLLFYYDRTKTQHEGRMREALMSSNSKYALDIAEVKEKNKGMAEFFQKLENGTNNEHLDDLLKHGRTTKPIEKVHAVAADDTENHNNDAHQEGATEQEATHDETAEQEALTLNQKKKYKFAKPNMSKEENEKQQETHQGEKNNSWKDVLPVVDKQTVTIAVVATVAAAAGFLMGGNSRQ
jgi:hypothetical protein